MGSRPPRQHNPPRAPQRPNQDLDSEQQTGLRMESLSVFIGFATFPVALGSAAIAYINRQDASVIGIALVLSFVAAGLLILLARAGTQWRRDARMSNELVLGLLIAVIGVTLLLGGIAGLSLPWIVAGGITLAIAWGVTRTASRTTA